METEKIILTPEELFYLGGILQAKYIDYAYLAAMEDIQQGYKLYESAARDGLIEKKVLMVDFSGNEEVDERVKKLLLPVFFGEFESMVVICTLGEEAKKEEIRLHFYEGTIIEASFGDGGIILENTDDARLQNLIAGFISRDYKDEKRSIESKDVDQSKITRLLSVKNMKVGIASEVHLYLEYDGQFWMENENSQAEALQKEEFLLEIYKILKGE